MLLSSKKIKVALATTHIPLTEVAKNIRKAKLVEIIQTLHSGLKTKFKIKTSIDNSPGVKSACW